MYKEAADLAAQLGNYPKAIQRFEQVSLQHDSTSQDSLSIETYRWPAPPLAARLPGIPSRNTS